MTLAQFSVDLQSFSLDLFAVVMECAPLCQSPSESSLLQSIDSVKLCIYILWLVFTFV
jgi:hypothetical protein